MHEHVILANIFTQRVLHAQDPVSTVIDGCARIQYGPKGLHSELPVRTPNYHHTSVMLCTIGHRVHRAEDGVGDVSLIKLSKWLKDGCRTAGTEQTS